MSRCFLSVFLFLSGFGYSQSSEPKFQRITTENGLSHSWIRSVYQDETGYIWFATADGLNRFDGFSTKIYKYSENDSTTIGSNSIRFMEFLEKKKMWVGTDDGVFIYDAIKDYFEGFGLLKGKTVRRILDLGEVTWFGTDDGLFHYDKQSKSLTNFVHSDQDSTTISDNRVYELLYDSEENLWIGTRRGLNLFLPDTKTFIRYLPSDSPGSISENWISGLSEDRWGRLWAGSPGGLDLFVDAKERPNIGIFQNITSRFVLGLKVTNSDELWIGGGAGNGLGLLDLNEFDPNKKASINWYKQRPFDDKSLSDNSIIYLFEDRLGDMWLGTYGGGVSHFSPRKKKFEVVQKSFDPNTSISSNQVNAFLENNEFLWIGTEAGLDRINKTDGSWAHFCNEPSNPLSLGANAIYSLFQDSNSNIWVGTWNGGLNKLNNSRKSFLRYSPKNNAASLNNPNVFAIAETPEALLIGTIGGGLNVLNKTTGSFDYYLNDPSEPKSLLNNSINDILVAQNSQIYISSQEGIQIFDPDKGNFEKLDLLGKNGIKSFYMCLTEDEKGNIWIGTNKGVIRYDPKNTLHIKDSDGLINNSVMAILEDDKEDIWVSTNGGLSHISIGEKYVITNYDKSDGLPSTEFIKRSAYKNKNGRLYFGTSNGYVSFLPSEISDNKIPPVVLIDAIDLKKNPRSVSGTELNDASYLNKPILLKHDQSDFEIHFKGIDYLSPESTTYRYRLLGYEDNWQNGGMRRTANYTNLPPGQFTFQVIGANNDEYWSPEITELSILIEPAWYDRMVFRLLMYGTLAGLIAGIFVIRSRMYKRNQRLLEEMVARRTTQIKELNQELKSSNDELSETNLEVTQQRNELAIALKDLEITMNKLVESEKLASLGVFTAGIAHEINNPMNYISGATSAAFDIISELKENKPVKPTELSKLKKMRIYVEEGIERVTKIIGGLRNYARQDDDDFYNYNIITCIEDALIILENRLKDNQEIVKVYDEEVMVDCQPGRISQAIVNLITNAADSIKGKGTITISVLKHEESITISVSDNGSGIDKKVENRLFDPFFTTKDVGQGTGLGLYITHGFVAKHGGSISFETEIGKGTTFFITLPLKQTDSKN